MVKLHVHASDNFVRFVFVLQSNLLEKNMLRGICKEQNICGKIKINVIPDERCEYLDSGSVKKWYRCIPNYSYSSFQMLL